MKRNNPILAVTVLATTAISSPTSAQERPAPSPVDLSEITNAFLATSKSVVEHRSSAGAIDGWQITAGSKLGRVHSTVTITIPQDENGLRPISAKEVAENRKTLEESAARAQAGEAQFLGRTVSQAVQLPSGEVTNQNVTLPNGVVSNTWTPWFLACANGMVTPPANGAACNLLTADTLPQGNPNVQFIALEVGDNSGSLSGPGTAGPNIVDDAQQYATFYGIQQKNQLANGTYGPNVIIQNADGVAPPPNTTTSNNNGNLGIVNASEARMDVEALMATNPNAAKYIVLQFDPTYKEPDGSDATFHAIDVTRQIAAQSPNMLTVVSISAAFGGSDGTANGKQWVAAADKHFLNADSTPVPNYVVVASSGDYPGYPAYPCTSNNVVCVGGTTLNVDRNNNLTGQSMWYTNASSGSAAGVEPSEMTADYQKSLVASFPVALPPGQGRLTPDISYSATNFSMVLGGHWLLGTGTSVSAPLAAGVISNIPLAEASQELASRRVPFPSPPSGAGTKAVSLTTQGVLGTLYANALAENQLNSSSSAASPSLYKPNGTCGTQNVMGVQVPLTAPGTNGYGCDGLGTPIGLSGFAAPLRGRRPIRR